MPISNSEHKISKCYRVIAVRFDFPNVRHLRVFVETLRTGSVSTAAKLCNLSQPAATQGISKLEERVGTALLNRSKRYFGPTDCGAAFQPRAIKALAHLERGARAAARGAGDASARNREFHHLLTAAQIRTLIAIAQTGSFALAARSLGLSQPTVHRAARSLEALAETPLFVARHSGVNLSNAAEAFVIEAKLAHAEIRQGFEEISRLLGAEKGTFVLGSLPLARAMIVPKSIHAMVTKRPGVQIRVVDGRYAELLRSLREGDLDCLIGALRHPHPADDVVQEVLFRDALAVVCHPSHPLSDKDTVSLAETMTFPWVAPPKETPSGQYLFEALRIGDLEQSPVRAVSSSMAVLKGILAEGDYISIVSRHQVRAELKAGLIAAINVPLEDNLRDIGLTYRRDWQPTETQAQFIEFLKSFTRNLTDNAFQ